MKGFLISLIVASFIGLAFSEVLHLGESDFAKHMDGSTNLLVEFYAPW